MKIFRQVKQGFQTRHLESTTSNLWFLDKLGLGTHQAQGSHVAKFNFQFLIRWPVLKEENSASSPRFPSSEWKWVCVVLSSSVNSNPNYTPPKRLLYFPLASNPWRQCQFPSPYSKGLFRVMDSRVRTGRSAGVLRGWGTTENESKRKESKNEKENSRARKRERKSTQDQLKPFSTLINIPSTLVLIILTVPRNNYRTAAKLNQRWKI